MIRLVEILEAGVTDDAGLPLGSGQVYSYTAGTTSLTSLYQDFAKQDPHSNPLTLDAAGRITAYAEDRVKLVIVNSAGAVIRTIDNVGTSDTDLSASLSQNIAGNGLLDVGDGTIAVDVDGVTLTIAANKVKVQNGGITTTQIAPSAGILGTQLANAADIVGSQLDASAAILGSQLSASAGILGTQLSASAGIVGGQLTSGTITGTQIASSILLPGLQVQAGGQYVVTQAAEQPYMTLRAQYDASQVLVAGGGISGIVKNSAGNYTLTFSTAFGDTPVCFATCIPTVRINSTTFFISAVGGSTTTAHVVISLNGSFFDEGFTFFAVGLRP